MKRFRAAIAGGVAVVVVCGAALYIWHRSRPLPKHLHRKEADVRRHLAEAKSVVSRKEAKLNAVAAPDPEAIAKSPHMKAARARLAEVQKRLVQLEARANKLHRIVNRNRRSDKRLFGRVSESLVRKLMGIRSRLQWLRHPLSTLRANLAAYGANKNRVTAARSAAARVPTRELQADLLVARKLHAKHAGAIAKRMKWLRGKRRALEARIADYVGQGRGGRLRYREAKKKARLIEDDLLELRSADALFRQDLHDIPREVLHVLIDMKWSWSTREHRIRFVRDGRVTTAWIRVSRATYRRHADHLGMAISSKPKGQFAGVSIDLATPPGWAFVGRKGYGRWVGTEPNRKWILSPRKAHLIRLMGGRKYYTPVTGAEHAAYEAAAAKGKSYLGRLETLKGARGVGTRHRWGTHGWLSPKLYPDYYARQKRPRKRRPSLRIRSGTSSSSSGSYSPFGSSSSGSSGSSGSSTSSPSTSPFGGSRSGGSRVGGWRPTTRSGFGK